MHQATHAQNALQASRSCPISCQKLSKPEVPHDFSMSKRLRAGDGPSVEAGPLPFPRSKDL